MHANANMADLLSRIKAFACGAGASTHFAAPRQRFFVFLLFPWRRLQDLQDALTCTLHHAAVAYRVLQTLGKHLQSVEATRSLRVPKAA